MTPSILGQIVTVTVDRPLGTRHPRHPEIIYPVNYGYVEGIPAPDGDWQDAYILGVNEPIETFTGPVIAVIRRRNDVEDKWVVAPAGAALTAAEIAAATHFQEQYFQIELITSTSPPSRRPPDRKTARSAPPSEKRAEDSPCPRPAACPQARSAEPT